MTPGYTARLACLGLASFSMLWLAGSLLVSLLTPRVLRMAERRSSEEAARLLLAVRLLPAAAGLFAACGLCLPSYLWFEPAAVDEPIGALCFVLALGGLGVIGIALLRAVRSMVRTILFTRRCSEYATEQRIAADLKSVLVIDSEEPCLALTGIVRPRIVISRPVMEALTAEELAAVLRHEAAHLKARDNLRRLLLALAPGPAGLDAAWMSAIEFLADERAAAGDTNCALSLASALVRVARFGAPAIHAPTATAFLADPDHLTVRVERLLSHGTISPSQRHPWRWMLLAPAVAITPLLLRLVHEALERLI